MGQTSQLESEISQFLSKTEIYLHGGDMLSRMQALMFALGNPEKKLRIIHVAGTSGKTSTCYFLAALLNAAGFTTGLTVSPHIDTIRERATIDLAPLPENEWTTEIREFFHLVKKTGVKPSYFEFYMGFAFWLFQKRGVDYAIIETGLGGTWDGSNVARTTNKICLITDIGYDHTEILGEDLASIATEKAGIIHRGNTVFMYPQDPKVMSVVKSRVKTMHGDLHVVADVTKNFMARNFNLAKTAVNFVLRRDHRSALTTQQIKIARSVPIPARAECINYQGKTLVMDGSHNPQKLAAFMQYLDQKYPNPSRILLATLGSNKLDTLNDSMIILRKISDHIILTSFQNDSLETDRRTSIDADTLLAATKKLDFKTCEYIHDPLAALQKVTTSSHEQIIVTGSFYLLDHLRPSLLSQ